MAVSESAPLLTSYGSVERGAGASPPHITKFQAYISIALNTLIIFTTIYIVIVCGYLLKNYWDLERDRAILLVDPGSIMRYPAIFIDDASTDLSKPLKYNVYELRPAD
jgi:uncharacterized membrane protein AbrB (regulator of aidB expression)